MPPQVFCWNSPWRGNGLDTFSSLNPTLVFTDHLYSNVKQPCLKMNPTERKEVPSDRERKGFLISIPSDPTLPNADTPLDIHVMYVLSLVSEICNLKNVFY